MGHRDGYIEHRVGAEREAYVASVASGEGDRSKDWAERQFPEVGVGLFVLHGREILLGRKQIDGQLFEYGGLGGVFERLKSFGAAALRDLVAREIGPDVCIKDPVFVALGNVTRFPPKHFVTMNFVAEWEDGEPSALPTSSCGSWEWHQIDSPPDPLGVEAEHIIAALSTKRMLFDDRNRDPAGNYADPASPIRHVPPTS